MILISVEPVAAPGPAPVGAVPLASGPLEQADALARAGSSLAALARYRELGAR